MNVFEAVSEVSVGVRYEGETHVREKGAWRKDEGVENVVVL